MSRFMEVIRDGLPPRLAMRLRAAKNWRELYGLHAPGPTLTDMVPRGRPAVDAGANSGLYAYWIARSASKVHAFEPHPRSFAALAASAGPKVTPHNVGLSDRVGTATLHVPPAGFGEANLIGRGGDIDAVEVELRTLDSYGFGDLGFLKIDVEGHEEELLAGAAETIKSSRPVVFIEVEERHNPGGVERIWELFRGYGYSEQCFMVDGGLRPLGEFDLDAHQIGIPVSSRSYANNFLFRP